MSTTDYSGSLFVHFRRVEILRNEALSCKAIGLPERKLAGIELLTCSRFMSHYFK